VRQTLTTRQQAVLDHVLASEATDLDAELGSSYWRAQYRFAGDALRALVVERCDAVDPDHMHEQGVEFSEAQIVEHVSANVRWRWLDAVCVRAYADLLLVVGRCRSMAERAAAKHEGPKMEVARADATMLLDAAEFAAERLGRASSPADQALRATQLAGVRAAISVEGEEVELEIESVAALARIARGALTLARGRSW
jgi:hypothetical protein